jgi:hypothetical protein
LEEDVFSICCVLAVAESERDAEAMAEGMVREWDYQKKRRLSVIQRLTNERRVNTSAPTIIDDLAMAGLAKIRQDCCDIL